MAKSSQANSIQAKPNAAQIQIDAIHQAKPSWPKIAQRQGKQFVCTVWQRALLIPTVPLTKIGHWPTLNADDHHHRRDDDNDRVCVSVVKVNLTL